VYRPTWTKKLADGTQIKKKSNVYRIVYVDPNGVRRYAKGYKDKKSSQERARQLETEAARSHVGLTDPFAEARKKKIEDHLKDYDEHLKNDEVNPRHRKQTLRRASRVFTGAGAVYLQDITPDSVILFLNLLKESGPGRGGKGLGPRTRNSLLLSAKAVLNWCVKTRRLPFNPLACVGLAEEGKDIRRERRPPTKDELARLIEAARTRPLNEARAKAKNGSLTPEKEKQLTIIGQERALYYKTAFYTGVREGELGQVAWIDLDLSGGADEAGRLRIRRQVSKATREERVPIRPDLKRELIAWRELRAPGSDAELVFDRPNRPTKVLRRDLAVAGIPYKDGANRYLDIHSLRHGTATFMSQSKVPPSVAQGVMRQSTIELTLKTYTHPLDAEYENAVGALPSLPSVVASPGAKADSASDQDDDEGDGTGAALPDGGPDGPPPGSSPSGRTRRNTSGNADAQAGAQADAAVAASVAAAMVSSGPVGAWEADALPTELRPHVRPRR
jgi:integrase